MPEQIAVDAVAFDMGNTLTWSPLPDVLQNAATAFSSALEAFDVHIPPDRLTEAWATADREVNYPFATHFLQEEPFVQSALSRLAVPAPARALAGPRLLRMCREEIRKVLGERDVSELVGALQALQAKAKRLAVLSNDRSYTTPTLLKWLGLDGYFSTVLVSEDIGCEKPDPRMFQALIEAVDMPPERIAYIGDDTVRDVQAGQRAGLKTILWRPGGEKPEETLWSTSQGTGADPDAVLTSWSDLPGLIV